MKEGDYVRTKYGIKMITDIACGQDIRFDNTDGFDEDLLKYHNYDGISKNSNIWKEIVIGDPKERIIELIEAGDYVNGCPVLHKENNELVCGFLLRYKGKDIKTVVTKEQFESMEYNVD